MTDAATMTDAGIAAQTFRLRTPLLRRTQPQHPRLLQGRDRGDEHRHQMLCRGRRERVPRHAREDHTFIVLQGRARFYQPDRAPQELGRNEGILIPAGALYKFEVASDEPLVLLRVGNVWQPVAGETTAQNSGRQDTVGAAFGAEAKANKGAKGVPIPGAFYE